MTLREKTINFLQDRKDRVLAGKTNCIPSPFVKFSDDFVGIEKGSYVLVSGYTKSGK